MGPVTSDPTAVPRTAARARRAAPAAGEPGLGRTVTAALRRALAAVRGTRPRDVVVGAVAAVAWFCVLALASRASWFPESAALALSAAALGFVVHRLATARRALAERDVALADARDEHAEAEVRAERTRIARELHDVVAHHISGIVLRAEAANLVADEDPDEPREAVRAIAGAGREALDAVRSVVRMLRDPHTDGTGAQPDTEQAPDGTPWHPTDTMAELPAVIARVASAGLQVDTHLPDPLPRLGAAAELAVVRVAAEALTNVLLHSQAARAELWLDVSDDRVQLGVADPGPPVEDDESSGGHGLMHMRERAASVAGTLEAGPDWPGWLVVLEVPTGVPGDGTAAEDTGEGASDGDGPATDGDDAARRSYGRTTGETEEP